MSDEIVIISLSSFENRGVEALAVTTLEGLRDAFPDAHFSIHSIHADFNSQYFDDGNIEFIKDEFALSYYKLRATSSSLPLKRAVKLLMRPIFPNISRIQKTNALETQEKSIRNAKVVIASGGDNFSSDYGSPSRWLRPLNYAQKHNVPTVFLAQSIGPFRDPNHLEAFVSVANKAHLITVRERKSFDYVVNELNIDENKVYLTADTAFLLRPAADPLINDILSYYGVDSKLPKIAIAASEGISKYSSLDPEQHKCQWIYLIKSLLERYSAQIILIPHSNLGSIATNDQFLAADLVKELGYPERVFVANLNHSAAEFKGIIAKCDMLIAERMHAAIAGLSSGVSTIVIGYSVKANGIFQEIIGQDPFKAGVVVPDRDFTECKATVDKIVEYWERRDSLAAVINKSLPEMMRRARRNFELLSDLNL